MKVLMVILFLISATAKSETVIQLHTVSYHIDRTVNYNEENYGIGVRLYKMGNFYHYKNIGFYKNSEYKTSKYIGIGWQWKVGEFNLGINAGIITGYSLGEYLPYIVPTINYKRVTLVVVPYPSPVYNITIDILKFN
ncbi:MAG: hypothetical protein ACUZ8H_02220 [Candidatus Anammoxibacter sp.]